MNEAIKQIEDMPLIIDWDLRQQFGFIFEVPVDKVKAVIPQGLNIIPLEPRPGVGLMFFGYNDYNPGNVIYGRVQPRFDEITRVFIVQPNLSIDMPLPRFTFFMHRISSNNQDFIDQEVEKLHLPVYYTPSMRAATNDAKTEVKISDDYGDIEALINAHPHPVYIQDAFYGQYYVVEDGALYFGVFYASAQACIHQRRGSHSYIYPHRFLTESGTLLTADDIGDTYMQIITKFGAKITQRFYQPRLLRKL